MYENKQYISSTQLLWKRFKDVQSLLKLQDEIGRLPDSLPEKMTLLQDVKLTVPQAAASDTNLFDSIKLCDDLRNQISLLNKENDDLKVLIGQTDSLVEERVTKRVSNLYRNMPVWRRWLFEKFLYD